MEIMTGPSGSIQVETVMNGPLETNTYVLISAAEAVIVDPAWDGARLLGDLRAAHPRIAVRAIICTHGHADHVCGVGALRAALGPEVPFLISRGDAPMVGPEVAAGRRRWGAQVEDPGTPTRLLSEGDVIEFGTARLQVIEVPGHTPGGIVLFAATDEGDIALVGDTLFPGSHGRTDLEGGDERAMRASLAKLAALLPDDTRCLIGHGPSTTMAVERASNPFMSAS